MTLNDNGNKFHRAYVTVDLDAIDHNLTQLKSCLKDGVKALAIVKADAYGHGSVTVSKHIEDKIDYFAVASLNEAVELRVNGIKKPILILAYTSPSQYCELVEHDLTATIYNIDDARQLSGVATSMGKKAKIHIAVDTGMGRIGFMPTDENVQIIKEISAFDGLDVEGLFSHYACADCADKTESHRQTAVFDDYIKKLELAGVNIPIKHISNSAATTELEKQYDMCRLGISLYGLYPSDEVDKSKVNLIPAMEVIAHVIHIKNVDKGFKIGYGHIYETPSPKKIATVSFGYADGFNRCLTNVGYVLINGKKAPVVGKVCMDMIMVDVTEIDDVCVGDNAVIIGKSKDAYLSAEEFGKMSNSINYEVICNFMPRVTRIYKKKG